jgi:hypothetical protein
MPDINDKDQSYMLADPHLSVPKHFEHTDSTIIYNTPIAHRNYLHQSKNKLPRVAN